MGRYAIATQVERKPIDALNKLLDKEEDRDMQIIRDEMMENGLFD